MTSQDDPMDSGTARQQGLAGAGSVDYYDDVDSGVLPRKHAHQSTVIKVFISYGTSRQARENRAGRVGTVGRCLVIHSACPWPRAHARSQYF